MQAAISGNRFRKLPPTDQFLNWRRCSSYTGLKAMSSLPVSLRFVTITTWDGSYGQLTEILELYDAAQSSSVISG